MPAIDNTIALDYQQPDFARTIQAAQQIKAVQQQMQTANTLKAIFAQPGATDPKNMPNTLAKVSQVSPEMGLKMMDTWAQMQQRQAVANSDQAKADHELGQGLVNDAVGIYDGALKDNVDPEIARQKALEHIHSEIDDQPWSDEKKAKAYQQLAGLSPAQWRQLTITPQVRAETDKLTMERTHATMGGKDVEVDKAGNVYDPNTGQKIPVTSPLNREGTSGSGEKLFQNGRGDVISFTPAGGWENQTTGEKLEGPPDDLTTMASGAARSAPAMALREYMRSPSYQNLPPEDRPAALAQFNAGFHNVQIGGTASAKADQSSLTNITKIADASEAFENTAMRNFDQALKLAPKGIKTDMGPLIERWVQDPEKALGDPGVPAYQAALLTAANEYAKVIAGSTGSQGSTVDSRREAAEMFSSLYNTDQIESVIGVAKRDMDNKIASYSGQREGIKARLQGETGVGAGGTPTGGRPPPAGAAYHSPQDVYNAVHSGKLSRDAGIKILRDDFGYR